MILDIENEDDFIRETQRFIASFEMSPISKTSPYSIPLSNLKYYLYQSIDTNSYLYLNLSYLYELLKSIEYAYINVDKERDFLYSSLHNHLTVLLKTDYQSLDNENDEESDDEDYDEDED